MSKHFLFLQGPCSPFFQQLGLALRSAGHQVSRLNFNAGDACYWRIGDSFPYRQGAESLAEWYEALFNSKDYTDIVLFGDHRPVHKPAVELARKRNIRTHVFEEGYFRPYWVTLERGGVNAHSQLPKDPTWYKQIGPKLPDYGNGQPFPSPFAVRAWHDIVYHAANVRNFYSYPRYRTHSTIPAHVEYLSYVRRAIASTRKKNQNLADIQSLIYGRTPFWLLALQLNSDAQIRHHSPFENMQQVLELTIQSFARICRPDAILVVKNHPLDPGLEKYERKISDICRQIGLQRERVLYLETAPLPALLNHARGVITVNSTVGGSALVHGRPLKALGSAIYDMPGLTFQGDLDSFWRRGKQPDARLFRWFRNAVIHTTQINGGLYSQGSIGMSVAAAIPRILADYSPLEKLR